MTVEISTETGPLHLPEGIWHLNNDRVPTEGYPLIIESGKEGEGFRARVPIQNQNLVHIPAGETISLDLPVGDTNDWSCRTLAST